MADLPIEPSLLLIQSNVAPAHVEATYRYLIDTPETPNMNNIFRAFGSDPTFLTAVVDAQVEVRSVEAGLERANFGACTPCRSTLTTIPARSPRARST